MKFDVFLVNLSDQEEKKKVKKFRIKSGTSDQEMAEVVAD